MERERDEKGRFIAGWNGGPGRPKKKRDERYYEIMQQSCTFADWGAIVKRAVAQAKKGDRDARKWLSDYLLGPPAQRHEHSGRDGGAIEIFDVTAWVGERQSRLGDVDNLDDGEGE